jgi:hypothetical protein
VNEIDVQTHCHCRTFEILHRIYEEKNFEISANYHLPPQETCTRVGVDCTTNPSRPSIRGCVAALFQKKIIQFAHLQDYRQGSAVLTTIFSHSDLRLTR